jgi:hypothetical protein
LVLGAAFTVYRFNPRAMILLPLVLFAGLGALSAPLTFVMIRALDSAITFADPLRLGLNIAPAALGLLGIGVVSLLIIPFIAVAVHAAVLGHKISIGQIWEQTRSRIPAVLGYSILLGLAMSLPAGLLLLPLIGIVSGDTAGAVVGVVLIILMTLGYLVYAIWLGTKTVLAGPAIVLERLGPIEAVGRSFRLTRGAFWPVLGTYYLGSIIASVAAQIVSYVIMIPLSLTTLGSPDFALVGTAMMIPATVLTMAITMPFTYAVVTLIYIDRRIKSEAYDVDLVRQSAPSTPAQFGWVPPAPADQPQQQTWSGQHGVWNSTNTGPSPWQRPEQPPPTDPHDWNPRS